MTPLSGGGANSLPSKANAAGEAPRRFRWLYRAGDRVRVPAMPESGAVAEVATILERQKDHPGMYLLEDSGGLTEIHQDSILGKIEPRHTHCIVVAENHWGKGATLDEAKEAYKKVRGKPFPKRMKLPKGPGIYVGPTYTVWACTPETTVNDMGGFNYKRGDPTPVKLEESAYKPK